MLIQSLLFMALQEASSIVFILLYKYCIKVLGGKQTTLQPPSVSKSHYRWYCVEICFPIPPILY